MTFFNMFLSSTKWHESRNDIGGVVSFGEIKHSEMCTCFKISLFLTNTIGG